MLNESRTRATATGIVSGVAAASGRLGLSHPRGGRPSLVGRRGRLLCVAPLGSQAIQGVVTMALPERPDGRRRDERRRDERRGERRDGFDGPPCAHPLGPHGTPPDGLRLRAERLREAAGRA